MSVATKPKVAETRFAGVAHDPEALDEVVGVTSVKGWLALATVLVALVAALVWSFTATVPQQFTVPAVVGTGAGPTQVIAGAEGAVEELSIVPGQLLAVGNPVASVRTLAGDVVEVEAATAGVVREVLIEQGEGVEALTTIASTSPTAAATDDVHVVAFVSALRAGPYLSVGGEVLLEIPDVAAGTQQALQATIVSVAEVPSSIAGMSAEVGDPDLAQQLFTAADGNPYRVEASIARPASARRAAELTTGQVASVTVVYANPHPIDLLFGGRG